LDASSSLIIGATYQAIVYLAVRLLVYDTAEFDERIDGIIYGTMAGVGIAMVSNLYFVLANDGVALGPGVIATVTTALAAASFGGLQGWFMAEARFEHKPVWWVPPGYVVVTVLNGVFSWLISEVSAVGLQVAPWRSLLMGLIVALGAFLTLAALMRRSTAVTLRRAGQEMGEANERPGAQRADLHPAYAAQGHRRGPGGAALPPRRLAANDQRHCPHPPLPGRGNTAALRVSRRLDRR
jgi:hypothetical protein